MVYKYYPPTCYTCDALLKGYFFFNKASKQNDPYDTSFKLIQSETLLKKLGYNEVEKDVVESIMKDYGSCCFSEERDNKHLWSFYASNYQGLVIGFDETTFAKYYNDLLARIHYIKVEYRDSPITEDDLEGSFQLKFPLRHNESENELLKSHKYKDCLSDSRLSDVLFTHLCCLKEKKTWEAEKEYRLIAALDILQFQERLEQKGVVYLDNGYKIPMPKNCVKEIYLGHNFDMGKFEIIEEIAKKHEVKQIYQTKTEIPFDVSFKDITNQFNL